MSATKILKATAGDSASAVNSLAEEGKISPVSFRFNGVSYTANSIWAATDFLKENGYYPDRNGNGGEGRCEWLIGQAPGASQ